MKTIISTDSAPAAIGPYSQAVIAGNFLYCSGQIPINPKTGELVSGSIEDETRQVLNNLKAVVTEAGFTLAEVVKTTVFLTDLEDFVKVNGVYGEYFSEEPPARACVEVSKLPKGVRVEIEAIARK